MTYTATGNGQIGERGLYSDISSYDATTDGDKLITASALNATFTNLPTTPTTKLECANSPACTLWTIVDQTAYAYKLPDGYTRLEYIESTGTQYIDTGVTSSNVLQIKVTTKYRVNEISSKNFYVFGSLDRNAGVIKYSAFGSLISKYEGIDYNNNYAFTASMTQLDRVEISVNTDYEYEIKYENQISSVKINNITKTYSNDNATKSIPLSMYMFKGNDTNITSGLNGRIYYLKIELNGTLVRDFIPARRESDGVSGMYDTVSGTFFTNAATSGPDFTPGPTVN
jgi:hypothetical protein